MEALATWIQILLPIGGGLWIYGTASDHKRAQFRRWLSEKASASKPYIQRLLLRLGCGAVTVAAGWIVWDSIIGVIDFKSSAAPLSRRDVFLFVLNAFNGICYAVVTATFFGLTIRRNEESGESGRLVVTLNKREYLTLKIVEGADINGLIEALKRGEVCLQMVGTSRGKVKVRVDAPRDLLVLRQSENERLV
ncbi:hypothetical protein [Pseudomonas sp. SO81]|uniref:hypothetical protein n=1 Tax=Pseudomonas sp. SO81 TaxID=2983246 RepID=UPI0025A38F79|nr:hypothetical protein [Pseudomonas sp. SO81]WJN60910.1 hypothetical protein OH686_19370 [Pseudomonas sp. SO81]